MKKYAIIAILVLILAIFISGCQTAEKETTIIVSDVIEEPTASAPTGMFCKDSDRGNDKNTAGVVTGLDENGEEYEFEDECVVTWLIEYYCKGNKVENQNYICDNDCKKGACI